MTFQQFVEEMLDVKKFAVKFVFWIAIVPDNSASDI